ncbi:EAL domain-containing protein [Paenibacillus sp. GCM10023248]|uniref:EAL domain-containing protein n=1 Tax=Bacillales TaxID=1385 RepID=UPI0023795C42|nr:MULTISPECIES: EAL domain-containing protein [Bacillales]MDD9267011.1 EAL domain-containing protein [Paenibacillus sp. MAHUQ-63]MDR6881212.1 EAL domain-containing protein (putative c-di-GMP-specific phosphodiesterase class I)/CheY-like chemotaxis protein [Bacillus sp. 3255]
MGLMDRYGVLIVSDSVELRENLLPVFERDEQFRVTGLAKHGNAALDDLLAGRPDLAVIDLAMPNLGGLTALQLIMNHSPIPIVVLNTHTPESTMQTVQAMRMGAADYYHKDMLVGPSSHEMMISYFLERCKMAVLNGIQGVYESPVNTAGIAEAALTDTLQVKRQQFQKRMDIEFHLRKAIANQEFYLVYQPVVDVYMNRIVGLESLIRWRNPSLGQVPPCDFIPVAEESGLIHEIGEWVLREACTQNKKWQDAGLPKLFVAVNLSRRQFNDSGLSVTIQKILEETGLQPKYLELEITESMSMEVTLAADALSQLKGLGVHVAMDDFGTGYSSLGYLKDFPIDKLKIDQSFIKGLKHRQVNAAIVNTVITMAKNLNLLVVAEGLESEEELQVLRDCGCRFVQGYYFSKPVQADHIEELLHTDTRVVNK